jgi:hypothetical protein
MGEQRDPMRVLVYATSLEHHPCIVGKVNPFQPVELTRCTSDTRSSLAGERSHNAQLADGYLKLLRSAAW